ncbi:MAG: RNA-binding protein [Verrucomicrobia bacterium]|nr:RNA-binding protein [Verrucomicrobiota bacterium]
MLHSERIQIERKTFTLSLRENPRGRFLRITEDVGGRHDTIIVPAPGLGDLLRVLTDIARLSDTTPLEAPVPAGEDGEPVALTAVD